MGGCYCEFIYAIDSALCSSFLCYSVFLVIMLNQMRPAGTCFS